MILVLVLALFALSILIYLLTRTRKHSYYRDLRGKHVLVTGGSSGIGKALAKEAVMHGASVTIVARNVERLISTKEELRKHVTENSDQKVMYFSVDVTKDFEGVKKVVEEAIEEAGNISILFNCAGTSVSYRFDETPIEEFKRMMDLNYFGSVYTTRAVLPSMKTQRSGKIVFVSSIAGLFGLYGYTAYAASKFALVGLAECLSMEVKPFSISVTVAFPPDTDTPGFAEEEKTKVLETRLISETGGIFSAEEVARKVFRDTMNKEFASSVGSDGWLIKTVCAGVMPVSSIFQLIVQAVSMGIIRLGLAFYLFRFDKIIAKCARERGDTKKES